MKKLILTTAAMLVSLNLFAQGTAGVDTFPVGPNILVAGAPATAATHNLHAGLMWSLTENGTYASLIPTPAAVVGQSIAGKILSGVALPVPGTTPGQTIWAYLQVWDAAFNPQGGYDAAYGNGLTGESAKVQIALGGVGTPPGPQTPIGPALVPFGDITAAVVPEPSAIALGLLGAGALLLLRRRR